MCRRIVRWFLNSGQARGDGRTALEVIRANRETLSLRLLDLLMPGMSGLEVIRCLREDQALRRIPVILPASDSQAEVQSLKPGAADFIARPYLLREVILARVTRIIELFEDRET